MQLEFLASRTLTLYLSRMFVVRIVAVLLMLVMVLQILDLLGQSSRILAYPGNGEAQLLHYVSLRAPQLVARFLPYSVLLATIITLATLNQNSEVIAMKAAGLSAHQVLAPLMLTALIIALFNIAFNERVVTRANAALQAWEDAEFGPIPEDSAVRSNVYLSDGRDILLASTLHGSGKNLVMDEVTFYRRNSAGIVTEQLRAPRAVFVDPGWKMDEPVRFDVKTTEAGPIGPTTVAKEISPEQIRITRVNADAQSLFELSDSIEAMQAAGRRTSKLEAAWWHKISGPLSAVLMPLLGAVAAFGLARSGQLLIRAVLGMALGFTYFVVDNAALAMGNFGGYTPLVAAWAPFLLFALVGETVLIRTEE